MSFDFLAVSATQSFIGRMSYSQEAMILIKKAVVMIYQRSTIFKIPGK